MRVVDEARQTLGQPVIASRHAAGVAHPLLHDAPITASREEKDVVIQVVAVLDGRVVDLRRRAAPVDERTWIASEQVAAIDDLVQRATRGPPLAARREEPEVAIDVF